MTNAVDDELIATNNSTLCLNTCVESMETCGEDVPVFDMDQERLADFMSNQEARAEPVCVGCVATGGPSVGPEAGEHHHSALANKSEQVTDALTRFTVLLGLSEVSSSATF